MIAVKDGVRHIVACFVFFGLLVCFSYPSFLIPGSSVKFAYYALVILPGLVLLGLDYQCLIVNVKKNKGLYVLCLLMVYWCLTLLWVDDVPENWGGKSSLIGSELRRLLSVFMYVVVIWHVVTVYRQYVERFHRLLLVVFAIGILNSFYSLLGIDLTGDFRLGTGSGFSQAIHAAHYYGFFFALSLGMIIVSRHQPTVVLALVVFILAFIAIILTKSRGGYVAIGITVLSASAYMAVIRKPVLAVAVALALLLLGGAMFYLYPQLFLNRGSSYRFDIWLESWNMIQQAPWFGIGLGARPPVLAQGFEHAHNLYLYQWLTTGLVGLVLFAVLVLVAIQGAVSRSKRRSLPYILAMIYFLAAMLTDVQYLISSPNEAWLCFWFCLVFLLSLEKKDNVGHKPLG